MGITKRRLEAEQADVNAELRLCIRCENRIEISDEQTISWRYEHSFVGPFTTIWLCRDCKTRSLKRCLLCKSKDWIEQDIPVCVPCLDTYEVKIQKKVSKAICERCSSSVEGCELDIYYDTGLCGWCSHMERKYRTEDQDWTPEKNLKLEERKIITPEEFQCSKIILPTDPSLLMYLASHPEEVRSLTPRRFEELIAALLKSFGYVITMGKGSKDGGVDVFAERISETGTELTIVQCKRNRADRKVGEPIIKQLYADVVARDATRGLVEISVVPSRL